MKSLQEKLFSQEVLKKATQLILAVNKKKIDL
jgi:hypothetical protein